MRIWRSRLEVGALGAARLLQTQSFVGLVVDCKFAVVRVAKYSKNLSEPSTFSAHVQGTNSSTGRSCSTTRPAQPVELHYVDIMQRNQSKNYNFS